MISPIRWTPRHRWGWILVPLMWPIIVVCIPLMILLVAIDKNFTEDPHD